MPFLEGHYLPQSLQTSRAAMQYTRGPRLNTTFRRMVGLALGRLKPKRQNGQSPVEKSVEGHEMETGNGVALARKPPILRR